MRRLTAHLLAAAAPLQYRERSPEPTLPTLIRFVIVVGGLAALAYGGLYYLATFVQVPPHEITETVDLPKMPK
jgi:hypothetical protein